MTLAWLTPDTRCDDDRQIYGKDPAGLVEAAGTLLELLKRPAWQADVACRGQGPDTFFTGRGEPTEPAKAICDGCTVREECLAYALTLPSHEDQTGIWGGTSARQRRQMRRAGQIAA